MGMSLSTFERESLRKLQRNLCGSSAYVRVTCIDFSTVYLHKCYWNFWDSFRISALRKELREYVYTDWKSVARWINATFGIKTTFQGIVDLLIRIGFTYTNAWIEKRKYPGALEIHTISDNARYYHNKKIFEWVQGTRIWQIFSLCIPRTSI